MTVLAHRHGSRHHVHDFEPRHRHLLMPQPAVLEDEVRPQAPAITPVAREKYRVTREVSR